VVERRCSLRFLYKAIAGRCIETRTRWQKLEGRNAAKLSIACRIDNAHPSASDLRYYLEITNDITRMERIILGQRCCDLRDGLHAVIEKIVCLFIGLEHSPDRRNELGVSPGHARDKCVTRSGIFVERLLEDLDCA
jgi:hypothetical protein